MWFPTNNPVGGTKQLNTTPPPAHGQGCCNHKTSHTTHKGLVTGKRVTAVIAWGKRPVPFRTRKLRPTAPMVLHPGGCGRVGHRRTYITKGPDKECQGPSTLTTRPMPTEGQTTAGRIDPHEQHLQPRPGPLPRRRPAGFGSLGAGGEHGPGSGPRLPGLRRLHRPYALVVAPGKARRLRGRLLRGVRGEPHP